MKNSIKIDGVSYDLVNTGKTARLYREQFNEDLVVSLESAKYRYETALQEYAKLNQQITPNGIGIIVLENIGEELLCRIAWSCIKASNKNKKVKEYNKFIDDIDDYYGFIVESQNLFVDIIKATEAIVEQEDTESVEDENDKKKLN